MFILNTYQHRCSQIELVKELGYKYVNFQNICNVLFLHLSEDVNEPLELSVGLSDPEEVDLLAGHARVSVGRGPEHEVVEDGGVGRDPDAGADHDGHLELVPVLVAAPEGSLDAHLGNQLCLRASFICTGVLGALQLVVVWIKVVPDND